tara:strand:+ start:154 stop:312 length:159 start_codon:yes stop_codon:yes gene_type:complete
MTRDNGDYRDDYIDSENNILDYQNDYIKHENKVTFDKDIVSLADLFSKMILK